MIYITGRTVLAIAAVWGKYDAVKILLENGANVNAKTAGYCI